MPRSSTRSKRSAPPMFAAPSSSTCADSAAKQPASRKSTAPHSPRSSGEDIHNSRRPWVYNHRGLLVFPHGTLDAAMSSVDNLEAVDWLLESDEPEVSAATRKLRMLRTLRCGNKYERAARAQGATTIAGVDEFGRGALFGPVVAAAVILPPDTRIRGLRDSKQLVRENRERLAGVIRQKELAFAI